MQFPSFGKHWMSWDDLAHTQVFWERQVEFRPTSPTQSTIGQAALPVTTGVAAVATAVVVEDGAGDPYARLGHKNKRWKAVAAGW